MLGDGLTVATGFTVERTVRLGVSDNITVDLVNGGTDTIEVTLMDDAVSPENNEGVRVVTDFTPVTNTDITQLNFSQSPNQDIKAGTLTVFFEGNAILHDPDNQISSDADGDIINSTDALTFDNAVLGADATWSLEVNNQQAPFQFLFEGADDGTPFGTPAFQVQVVMNEIGFNAGDYIENDSPLLVTDGVALTHVSGNDLAQVRLFLSGFTDGDEEEITILGETFGAATGTGTINVAGITMNVSRDNNRIEITSPGARITLAQAEQIIESVQYSHTSEHPADGVRRIGFQLVDAFNNDFRDFSRVANAEVNVVSVNDAPVAVDDGDIPVSPGVATVIDPIFDDFDVDLDVINVISAIASQGSVVIQSDNTCLLYTSPSPRDS